MPEHIPLITISSRQDACPSCGGDPTQGDGRDCLTCDADCPLDPHRD